MPLFNPDTGTTLLFGDEPPRNLLLAPDDGVNSPWRWASGYWVGMPWSVSWTAGDVIPSFELGADVANSDVFLYVGDWSRANFIDPWAAMAAGDFDVMESFGPGSPSDPQTATGSGSGVAFLMQHQTYFPVAREIAPYYPEDPTWDVRDYLGDVVVDATFTFPPEDVEGDGEDGNYWLDLTARSLYGPRGTLRLPTGGGGSLETWTWPGKWVGAVGGSASLAGFVPSDDYTVTGDWLFSTGTVSITGDAGLGPGLVVYGGTSANQPPDASIPDGKVAVWYESTPASTKVHFKGKDTDGTVKTGNITLT